MTESRVNEAGITFQVGDLVRLRDKSETARIKGFYAVQIGGVFLDEQLDGFNSWNLNDLERAAELNPLSGVRERIDRR